MASESRPSPDRWKSILNAAYKTVLLGILSVAAYETHRFYNTLTDHSRRAVESVERTEKTVRERLERVDDALVEVGQVGEELRGNSEALRKTNHHLQQLAERVNGAFPFAIPKQRTQVEGENH